MQCEICSQKEAVVHFKHVADGEVRELNICEDCAAKNGLSIQPPDLLTDFLMGKTQAPVSEDEKPEPVKQCFACGMTSADFRKNSRLGCCDCYEAFESDVEAILAGAQQSNRHIGRIPQGITALEDVAKMKGMLDEAIATQNFEEAARIRDMIAEIEGSASVGTADTKSGKDI